MVNQLASDALGPSSSLVAADFSGRRQDWTLFLAKSIDQSTCTVSRHVPGGVDLTRETDRVDVRLGNFGAPGLVRDVSIVALDDAVYIFKRGFGSFVGVSEGGQFTSSLDFAQVGDNLAVVCLRASDLTPRKIEVQDLRTVRELLVRRNSDGSTSLTSLGETLMADPSRLNIRVSRNSRLTAEDQPRQEALSDVAITFTDPTTLRPVESYSFGGPGADRGSSGAFDAAGNLYVVGSTDGGFPVTPGAISEPLAGASDAFLIKISGFEDPTLAQNAIVGAADFLAGPIAPGSILSAFAQGAPGTVVSQLDAENRFPTELAGVRFLFDGDPSPLVFSTPQQSNLIAPFSLAGKSRVNVELEINGNLSPPVELAVAPTKPQIFSANQQGTGQAALLNQDFTPNNSANPAARGSVIQIFLTGGGQTDPPGQDGALVGLTEPFPSFSDVQVLIGGIEARVVYAGGAPGLVHGVGQINVVVGDDVTPGDAVSLEVRIGGVASQAGITVAVSSGPAGAR